MTTCPACASGSPQMPVFTVSADEAARHFIHAGPTGVDESVLTAEISRLWVSDKCVVLRCNECGTRHASPHVGGDGVFYDYAYPPTRNWYPPSRWEHKRSVSPAISRIGHAGRLLEVGAGDGAFLRLLLAAGARPSQLQAFEYSPSGRSKIAALGVRTQAQDFRANALERDSHDVIVMFQTLEHLGDLDGTMAALSRLTRSNGSVLMSVPHVDEIDFYETHGGPRDMPPNHITAFSLPGLSSLAHRHGWQVIESEREPEKLPGRLKRLATQRAFQRRHKPRGVAHRVDMIANSRMRRVAMSAIAVTELPGSILPSVRAWGDPGEALWVHLRRE